jgi:glycosyltransferase involved in cell wall biosynthesis
MNTSAILHVTSPFGGGVDRHLRDVLRGVDRPQLVWHAGDGADVIEDPRTGRFLPLVADATAAGADRLAQWLRARRVGLVHLHQLTDAPRRRAEWACAALGVPLIATLHDVLFLSPDAFEGGDRLAGDPRWLAETARVLRAAKAVLAPSRWLAELATARVPGLAVDIVPNGSAPASVTPLAPRAEFARHRPRHVVALLGALGPHKGSDCVDALASRLAGSDIGLVVIGYLDRQLHPGWRVPDRLFVHGAFAEGDAPGLLRGYGACLVLMPNEAPESFSYALSDAWAAGIPVLAAPRGALAERIAAHGGGWLLPEPFDVDGIAAAVRALAGGAREEERARVQSRLAQPDVARIPPLDAMIRSLDAFYARYGIDPAAPDAAGEDAIASLVAKNVDSTLFRKELVRLSDEIAQTLAALEQTRERAAAFESEARAWIAKLEADVRAVQAELAESTQIRGQQEAEIAGLLPHKEAFDLMPAFLRRLLLKLARDARR